MKTMSGQRENLMRNEKWLVGKQEMKSSVLGYLKILTVLEDKMKSCANHKLVTMNIVIGCGSRFTNRLNQRIDS